MRRILIASVAWALLAGSMGCNHGTVYLAVVRPTDQIPPNVKSVAVLPFAPKDAASSRYSEMAAQVMSARLEDTIGSHSNRPTGTVMVKPVSLMDFSKLPGLANADLADPATGAKAAKALNVDAALCGVVTVVQQDRPGVIPSGDPANGHPGMGVDVTTLQRVVTVTLEARLVQSETGQLLLPAKTLTGTFDSGPVPYSPPILGPADAPPGVAPTPPVGPQIPSMDDATGMALSNCVSTFSGGSSGLVACVGIDLAGGKSEIAKKALESAHRGHYPEAANGFQQAVADRPADHGSLYNLGVMKLLMGDLPGGMGDITKALQMKHDEKIYKTTMSNMTRATAGGNVQVRAATPAERLGFGHKAVKSLKPPMTPANPAPVTTGAPY